jgi:1,2-diacylglycerol 3-beta-galactosyltransferase
MKIISQKEQEEWHAAVSADEQGEVDGITQLAQETSNIVTVSSEPPPTYRIEIVDVFQEYSRFPLREAVKLYGPTIRYNPKLFGEVFHLSNRQGPVLAAQTLASPLILNGLVRLFTTVQPDIIVSIHPMLNHITVRALRQLGLRIPFLTVVTDLVSIHYLWFAEGVDGYIVPTEQAKEIYLKRGLDPARVHMLGMPIDPKFTIPTLSKEQLQIKLGLKPGIPVVLLVGGGDGAGGLLTSVRAISQAHLPVQLMVVTGRNRRLYANLQRSRSRLHVPAVIFGFVHNMPELMHASDVIITKAGPGTICEALACNLPIILSGYVPGQEEGNVEFVTKNGVGVLALSSTVLIDSLRRFIKPGSPELRRVLENAQRLRRPEASFDISKCILSYLSAHDGQSMWESAKWQRRRRMMLGRLRSSIRLRHLPRHIPQTLPRQLPKRLLKNPIRRRQLNIHTRDISNESDRVV